MALKDEIKDRLKHFMRNKMATELTVVRQIKTEIMKFETNGSGSEAQDGDVLKILNSLAKQHQESIDIFAKENRTDLLEKERIELDVIKSFMPANIEGEELEELVDATIRSTGAESKKDMGPVMKKVRATIADKNLGVDGKVLSEMIKAKLV